jgi:hypothetical protein
LAPVRRSTAPRARVPCAARALQRARRTHNVRADPGKHRRTAIDPGITATVIATGRAVSPWTGRRCTAGRDHAADSITARAPETTGVPAERACGLSDGDLPGNDRVTRSTVE